MILIISMQPFVIGQQQFVLKDNQKNLEIGQLIQSDEMVLELNKEEGIHVKHIIKFGDWQENSRKHIQILEGNHYNLRVLDEDGDPMGYGISGETFEESEYVVLKQKFPGIDLVIEYDIEKFLNLENNLWSKQIIFPFNVQLEFPEEIKIIFINSRPVDISDAKGINCIGCSMKLDFYDIEDKISKKVTINENEYVIDLISNGKVSDLVFLDDLKTVEFEVVGEERLIVVDIPFGIILNPFEVYFTEKNDFTLDQLDKIRKSEISQDENSVKVSFRTDKEGVVSIVSATEEEHELLISKIEERKLVEQEKSSENINAKKETKLDDVILNDSEIFEEWDKNSPKINSNNYNTIIYVIIGIVAVIIIGVIVKIKKN